MPTTLKKKPPSIVFDSFNEVVFYFIFYILFTFPHSIWSLLQYIIYILEDSTTTHISGRAKRNLFRLFRDVCVVSLAFIQSNFVYNIDATKDE